jgi:aerobic carbon-monoxide dehydrogenase large subunit
VRRDPAHDQPEGGYGIGSRARRQEIERFVKGAGTYVDDVHLPNQAFACFVRSIAAHAEIKRIDTEAARMLPGVIGVFSAAELSRGSTTVLEPPGIAQCPLATDRVRYVGDPVAVVIAESRYQAMDAALAVTVEYEELPVLVDPERAMAPDAPRLFPDRASNIIEELHFATVDVDRVFAEADRVVRTRLHSQRIAACPMEPRAVTASYDSGADELTVWVSSSGVHGVRARIAQAVDMNEARVRVIAPDVGGSFGAKNGVFPEEIILAYLARALRRPLKWAETRIEHLSASKHGRDQAHELELAVRSDGRILGLRDRIIADMGATARADNSLTSAFLYMSGPYDIQTYKVDAYGVATNKAAHGSVRGIGKADAAFVLERTMDVVAKELGIDPIEIRLRNFVPEEAFPYRTATGANLDSGRYHACLRRAAELAGYDQLRREQAALQDRPGIRRGIGVSFVIEPTNAARRDFGGGYGACRLRMEPSGAVSVYPNIGQQGQGHVTTITQIVAEGLRLPKEMIHVFDSDSVLSPYGPGTGSSRSSVTLMPAVHVAADLLRTKILRIAGHRLGLDPSDLRLDGTTIRSVTHPDRTLPLREVTQTAYLNIDRLPPDMEPALEVIGYFVNHNIVYEHDEMGRRNEFAAYPYEAVVAVIDLDTRTGMLDIVKYVSVHDCGVMLNPQIVTTQHLGCIAQGIGAALYEELRYDDDGRLLNGTFMDYLLPTVNEIPNLILDHMVTPTPFTPLGAKGAGETGMLSPPVALGNAIEDALKPLGVEVRELPYTPDRLLRLIKAAGGDGAQRTVPEGGARG